MSHAEATLDTIAGGAALELFALEFEKVLKDIFDPNTIADAKRKITIELVFDPGDARDSSRVVVQGKSKLAPTVKAAGQIFIGKKGGKVIGILNNPIQETFDEEAMAPIGLVQEPEE